MKKAWKWLEDHCLSLIIIILWSCISFFIWFISDLEINDKIQAWSIVTLVFITFFYATQTQKLVQQEKASLMEQIKKRKADYADKKLHEFYSPFSMLLLKLRRLLTEDFPPKISLEEIE